MRLALKFKSLLAHVLAANDEAYFEVLRRAEGGELLVDLEGEFAGGGEDEGVYSKGIAGPDFEDGGGECYCFS